MDMRSLAVSTFLFFCNGLPIAVFQCVGNCPLPSDLFIIAVIVSREYGKEQNGFSFINTVLNVIKKIKIIDRGLLCFYVVSILHLQPV